MSGKIIKILSVDGKCRIEVRVPTDDNLAGTIAFISYMGVEVEIETSFNTLDRLVDGILELKQEMRIVFRNKLAKNKQ